MVKKLTVKLHPVSGRTAASQSWGEKQDQLIEGDALFSFKKKKKIIENPSCSVYIKMITF